MEIKTYNRNKLLIKKDGGNLPLEIIVGVRSGYSDVLHFYFPEDCEVEADYSGGYLVIRRAEELDVDEVRLSARVKLPAYQEILEALGVTDRQTAVVGDDLPDLPILRRCGFAVASANAVEQVRSMAAYVTSRSGGAGCVREVVELILKKSGRWDAIMSRYL